MQDYVLRLEQAGMGDVDKVGGKNASLGEMIRQLSDAGVRVPGGFATTAKAYRDFLAQSGLAERINRALEALYCALNRQAWVMSTRSAARTRLWGDDPPAQ